MRPLFALVLLVALAACTGTPQPVPTPTPTTSTATPTATPIPAPTMTPVFAPMTISGAPVVLASHLKIPWSIVRLDSGSTFISERNTAVIKELTPSGTLRNVGTVPGVVPGGEGGLLGLAVLNDQWLYAYITASDDNRILRMGLTGAPGSYAFGPPVVIASGMRKAPSHNGGRIKFGPDGMLYATVGDARQREDAQNPASLNGKILRMTPNGEVPHDNPIPNSLVYSMGHRNPQGLTWDDDGQLWASEFGQDTWDEFNRIMPGGNYGWPVVEGIADAPGYIDPLLQWPTDPASPSGLVFTHDSFFMGALRGERIWAIYLDGAPRADPLLVGQFGRIRDVVQGPGDTLWFITNNTDGRGTPRSGDDRLWQVSLAKM